MAYAEVASSSLGMTPLNAAQRSPFKISMLSTEAAYDAREIKLFWQYRRALSAVISLPRE
jgi:hypothetical protein